MSKMLCIVLLSLAIIAVAPASALEIAVDPSGGPGTYSTLEAARDAIRENFEFRADSGVWNLGFEALPLEKMGLQIDDYRTTVEPVSR